MRIFLGTIVLALLVSSLGSPAPTFAGQHTEAKIITHADPIHAKCLPCVCTTALGPYVCDASAPLDVVGDLDYGYTHCYLQLVDLDPALGVREVSFGLDYDGAVGVGVDDVVWDQCLNSAYPSAAPDPVWPESGGWIRIVFDDCQGTVANPLDPEGDGSVVLGGYGLYAYSDDVFAVVPGPDPDFPGEFRVRVVDCSGEVTELGPDRLVRLAFGAAEGYNPCTGPIPVTPATWGAIKQQY